MELQEAFDQGFDAVKGYVDRSLASQAKRLAVLERTIAELAGTVASVKGDGIDALIREIAAVDKKVAEVADLRKDIAGLAASFDALPRFDAEKAVEAHRAETAVLVAETVQRAVATIPAPENGKDGAKGEQGDPGEAGAPGRDGIDGKDGASGLNGKDGLNGADGKDGAPGRDGKDAEPVTAEQIIEVIRSSDVVAVAVQQYFDANPVQHGKDGRDGNDGAPGRDGVDGKPGERGEKGDPGRDGIDGKDGVDGRDGEAGEPGQKGIDGAPGKDGRDGRDGLDVADIIRADGDRLIAVMSNGTTRDLGICKGADGKDGRDGTNGVDGKDGADGHDGAAGADGRDGIDGQKGLDGRDGRDGKDGADGIGFDDVQQEIEDDGRFIVQRWLKDDVVVREIRLQTKAAIWRGVHDPERTYLPGDMATWKGSIWHCNSEVKGAIGSENWSLAVKKPRDVKPEDVAKFLVDRG